MHDEDEVEVDVGEVSSYDLKDILDSQLPELGVDADVVVVVVVVFTLLLHLMSLLRFNLLL